MKLRAASLAALIVLVGGAGLVAAPSLARDLSETHTEIHQPGGKTPTRLYRPIARDLCAARPHTSQAGKLPKAHAPLPAACAEGVASRDAAPAAYRGSM